MACSYKMYKTIGFIKNDMEFFYSNIVIFFAAILLKIGLFSSLINKYFCEYYFVLEQGLIKFRVSVYNRIN